MGFNTGNGKSGYSGYSGTDGTIGVNGTSGYSGAAGTSGYSGYSGTLATLSKSITTIEAIDIGKYVNILLSGGNLRIQLASNADNTKPAHGYAGASGASGDSIAVYPLTGENPSLTGLTIGTDYYLSTAGGVTSTAPSTTGNIVQLLGRATATTAIWNTPSDIYEIS